MTRPVFVSMLALCAFSAPAWAQRTSVGTLSIVRQVEVTRTRATPQIRDRVERVFAAQGEQVFSEELVRTLKRSYAEVAYKDGTQVRLKDRTELIVGAGQTGINLLRGSVWVKAGATPVQIETPTGTVTAQKATVEVEILENGVQVRCYEGTATLRRDGRSVPLKAKEFATITVTGSQVSVASATDMPGRLLPRELGGPLDSWWQVLDSERGMVVFPGSRAGFALRSSALTEALQATLNVPPDPSEIINNASDKARLLSLSQSSVVPAIERTLASDATLTLGGYRQKFGGDDLSQAYALSSSDLSFLRGHGIGNVGELFDALSASGATFGVDLRSRPAAASRVVYRPSSWQGASNVRRSLFDSTRRSNPLSYLGFAAAALLDRGSKFTDIRQEGEAFGFTSDPAGLGGRVRLAGSYGQSQYTLEGNYLRLLTGKNAQSYEALSVASVERNIGTGVTAFAGRRRFYSGPALLNLSYSQLLGDRYSALGATVNKNGIRGEAAWLYDSNPDVRGAQGGFLASATRQLGSGTVGVQALRVGSLSNGTGFTVSGSMATSRGEGQIDVYGELGVAPDKSGVLTLGAYFPWIFQQSDTDVVLEYSSHDNIGKSLMLVANRALTQGVNLRAYLGTSKRTLLQKDETIGGVGISYALGR